MRWLHGTGAHQNRDHAGELARIGFKQVSSSTEAGTRWMAHALARIGITQVILSPMELQGTEMGIRCAAQALAVIGIAPSKFIFLK
jgi:hypothetical protein